MPTKTNAYIITLKSDFASVEPTQRCISSIRATNSRLQVEEFGATEPYTIRRDLEAAMATGILKDMPSWNWPMPNIRGGVHDPDTMLLKMPYSARDQRKVIACAVSHLRLWIKCIEMEEPIVVLEQDAIFLRKLDIDQWDPNSNFPLGSFIIGLNDPRGATRKGSRFHEMVVASASEGQKETFVPVPNVDSPDITKFGTSMNLPSGLPGNSAYYLTPGAAKRLVELVYKYGLWPNDAIMCQQLMPNMLYSVYPYYTKVQGTRSTTTT